MRRSDFREQPLLPSYVAEFVRIRWGIADPPKSYDFGYVALLLIVCLAGCGGAAAVSKPSAEEHTSALADSKDAPSAASPDAFPLTLTDGLGRRLVLPRPPARIVSLAPKNTEMLFAIGAGENVVGVTSFCNFPAEAQAREQVGGFAASSLSIEKIVGLSPDLVVSAGEFHQRVIDELDRLGTPVFAVAAESFEGMCGELTVLGQITGHEAQAAELVGSLKEKFENVRQKVASVPEGERVRVYCQISDEPLMAAGPSSFVGEMIALCRGDNIIHDAAARYPHINPEVLLDRDPEVILIPTAHGEPSELGFETLLPGWKDISGVKNHRVYFLDRDIAVRCGPRMVEAIELIARALYPDRFAPAQGEARSANRKATGGPQN